MNKMSRNLTNIKYEDTLQCLYFSTEKITNVGWEKLCDAINETVATFCQQYIWHRDEFKVILPFPLTEDRKDGPPHLISVTCFGDNIEDEWFIVYLLFELTKTYPNLIIQVEDNDGDFLLIESADYLPTWCNPENTENRVFIYKQNVHIIPPSVAPINSTLNLSDALQHVEQKSAETKASLEIQETILKRICNFSQHKNDNNHKAIVYLPLEIATVLTLKPSLISPLVTTYCSADVLDIKHFKDIQFNGCVNVEIMFTKYLYAMLLHTKFPKIHKFKHLENDKKNQLGIKLTCAYSSIIRMSNDAFSSLEYQKFIDSLTKNGYFDNNIQGSKEYNQLLEKAKTYFDHMNCPVDTYVCSQINKIKSSQEFNAVKESVKQKSDSGILEKDNEDWLNIQPNQLDDLLNSRFGKKMKLKYDDPVSSDLISAKLNNFLKETSDYEGIDLDNNDTQQDNNIEFDSDQFVNCLEKMLNIISNEDKSEQDINDLSSDDECVHDNSTNLAQDLELASKLKTTDGISTKSEKDVLKNFIQSIREERSSGPSSTVFRTIGVEKSDLLDSDDDM